MTEQEHPEQARAEDRCPHCGSHLVVGTEDLGNTPDVSEDVDREKLMLNPGQMVQAEFCPNPDCPGKDVDTGARV